MIGLSGSEYVGEEVGRSEMAQELHPLSMAEWSIAHYLPFVYYYLVGTSFETGTRRKERKKEHLRNPHVEPTYGAPGRVSALH